MSGAGIFGSSTIMTQALSLSEKATPGPWKCCIGNYDIDSTLMGLIYPNLVTYQLGNREMNHPVNPRFDVEFVAASRTLVPILARRLAKAIDLLAFFGASDYFLQELEQPIEDL